MNALKSIQTVEDTIQYLLISNIILNVFDFGTQT